ncbi:MAG: ABC transporter [Nocardioides sp.]|nr:ABC transporter [Nocardioides sp.]
MTGAVEGRTMAAPGVGAEADDPQHAADTGVHLRMEDVSKHFGGAKALDRVSLDIEPGEVHALCGANGAGKSTLVKILAGAERADSGRILLDGTEVRIDSPRAAAALGLTFVHQELNLVPKLTALQNMSLGLPGRLGVLDRRGLRERAARAADLLGYAVPLDTAVEELSVSDRWMVSLSRSLMRPAHFVAMDEPTASFTDEEAERLYGVIDTLTAQGVGVLYISHRLEEVLEVSDRITVMRNGTYVGTYAADEMTVPTLTHQIVGGEVEQIEASGPVDSAERTVRLAVEGLTRAPRVLDVGLEVHRGEILGIAGLVGAGRTELARLVVGADRATSGRMTLDGEPYAPRSVHDAIRAGVCLVPEERRAQGLVLAETVDTNLAMASIGRSRSMARGFSPRRSRRIAQDLLERFWIKARSVDDAVNHLSGGNQQKVVVAKYVRNEPSVLILDEPTVGVDVGARAEIYRLISRLAEEGTAVVVISSDFEELAICHRVLVMREGRVTASVDAADATKTRLTELCFGHDARPDDHPDAPDPTRAPTSTQTEEAR